MSSWAGYVLGSWWSPFTNCMGIPESESKAPNEYGAVTEYFVFLKQALGWPSTQPCAYAPGFQIPVFPELPLIFWHELLGGLCTGFLVVSPSRTAGVLLHWERGRRPKRVWCIHRIIYPFIVTSIYLHDYKIFFDNIFVLE
jgi:hypothetical protein